MNLNGPLRLFLIGPALVVFLIGCAAALTLAALLVGRLGSLTRLGTRAAARLEAGWVIPALWGLAASLLVFLLAAVLFNTHVLALLGVLVLASGFALAGLGLAVAALSVGTRLGEAFPMPELGTLGALQAGVWILGLAAGVPIAGWLVVLPALASGIGVVLETLVVRTPDSL